MIFSNVKKCARVLNLFEMGLILQFVLTIPKTSGRQFQRLDKSVQMSLDGAAQGGGLFESTPSAHPHICFPLSHVKKPKHPKHSPFPFHFNRLNTFLPTSSSLQNFNEGLFC